MKNNTLGLIITTTALMLVACTKSDILNNDLSVDIKKYESTLNANYADALLDHKAVPSDPSYYKMMFNTNDSLFSEHFYDFCIDMMNNSGMMGTTGGMMGNNSSMMGGSTGMMNGSTMGSQSDMIKMMDYMNGIHLSSENIMNPDYLKTDSLMYNQMSICKMMTIQTKGITTIFGKMQTLRKTHQLYLIVN
jgi:hypothetical protein